MAKTASEVPLDLASLVARGQETGQNLTWPTAYGAYDFLAVDLVDAVCAAARAEADTPELDAVVEAKLSDLTIDLGVLGRLCVDLRAARRKGLQPVYDPKASRWTHYLVTGDGDPSALARLGRWHFAEPTRVASRLKRGLRRVHSDLLALLGPKAGRHDVLGSNLLLQDYYSTYPARRADISANYRNWPMPGDAPRETAGLARAAAATFSVTLERALGERTDDTRAAERLADVLVSAHFAKAWSDLEKVQRVYRSARAGAVLSGGTPKHIGRLIGWQYRRMGREVIRFAHGGERAFYDDYSWPLGELPSCDRYMCHSRGEARRLARRREDGRIIAAGPQTLAFESAGSLKHQKLREAAFARPRPRTGTVMYVAGGYLGEELGDFPSRKPPDVLYLDWQKTLLSILKSRGFKVLTKVHPRGIFNEHALLGPHCDGIVGGFFDPVRLDADCYIFDFAGTAFFDALASGRGVLLTDMGIRPRDAAGFADLATRCEIVACSLDEANRFRIDADALADGVERASEARSWPDAFFSEYFGG